MTDSPTPQACLFGVGTGPGDPDLLTVKAARLIETADVIAYFAKRGHDSQARRAVAARIPAAAVDLPLLYPVTTELDRKSAAYTAAMRHVFVAWVGGARVSERRATGTRDFPDWR